MVFFDIPVNAKPNICWPKEVESSYYKYLNTPKSFTAKHSQLYKYQ